MMQVTRVKQDGTAWNFSLHYQIMGYFSHPNAVCEFPPQHTEAGREGKKNFFWPLNFLFSFFFSSVLQKNWVHQVSELN